RRGVGTRNHCVHGEGASLEEVLDWRPHEYFTVRSVAPGLATWVAMEELTPTEMGTHLTIRLQRPRAAKDRSALEERRDMILGLYQHGLDRVREEFSRHEEPAGIG
ncbi:MAG TPA: hypothetical protein VHK28_08130, partial [Candidatus Limnocylindria bacterium]|nr:hypothetical protein [Candidatus Limnocylindria bacterium]